MKKKFVTFIAASAFFLAGCGSTVDDRQAVTETVNRLFIATDNGDWDGLHEIFTEEVAFDMTSLVGGQPSTMKAVEITGAWKQGLAGLKVHHLVGNHIVKIDGDSADAFCYGVATHYLENPTGKNTRTFAGSYDFKLTRAGGTWKVSSFKYNHKYLDGNPALHTHVQK